MPQVFNAEITLDDMEFDRIVSERLKEAYEDMKIDAQYSGEDKDSAKLLKALKRVHNFFAIPSKHIQ